MFLSQSINTTASSLEDRSNIITFYLLGHQIHPVHLLYASESLARTAEHNLRGSRMTRIYTPNVLENLQPFTSRGTNIYTTARRLEILEMVELKQEVSVSRVTFSRPTFHTDSFYFLPLSFFLCSRPRISLLPSRLCRVDSPS